MSLFFIEIVEALDHMFRATLVERTIVNGADLVLDVDHAVIHVDLRELIDLLAPPEPFTTMNCPLVPYLLLWETYQTHSAPTFSRGRHLAPCPSALLPAPRLAFSAVQTLPPPRAH